jgi:putative acetyltransferase
MGLGLAPVAVVPTMQKRGVGAQLIRSGLEQCKQSNAPFVVVLGDPSYYQRFGFRPAHTWGIGNEYEAHEEFMVMELISAGIPQPAGIARYAKEFSLVA